MSVNIVRVKRKINEPVADSLVVSYKKRRKCSDENNPLLKQKLEFAGTSGDLDEDLTTWVKKAVLKKKLEQDYKKYRPAELSQRTRKNAKKQTERQRFKIVCERRGLKDPAVDREESPECSVSAGKSNNVAQKETSASSAENDSYSVYDLVKDTDHDQEEKQDGAGALTCNGVPLISEKSKAARRDAIEEPKYVYDIYYVHSNTIDFRALEHDLQFEYMHDEDMALGYQTDSDEEFRYEDDDDENDEDNWRNDYPDEDDMYNFYAAEDNVERDYYDTGHFSQFVDDRLKIKDSDDELSSDSEEDRAYSSRHSNNHLWTPQTSYDVYKMRMKKELYEAESDDT